MVKLTKIYTRTGDRGETGLVDGQRRSKTDARFHAIGDVDETNAAIGLARAAMSPTGKTTALLENVQNDLFDIGADLATPDEAEAGVRITAKAVESLEHVIDKLTDKLGPLESFVLPGGSEVSARLHLARTVARRAERSAVEVAKHETVSPLVLAYLNRLSDMLFQLARAANQDGKQDILWRPGGKNS